MTQNLCIIDETPVTDIGVICHACTDRMGKGLEYIPELMDDLAVMFTKRAKIVDRSTGPSSGDDGKPMVYSVAASKAREDMEGFLRSWVSYVHDTRTIVVSTGTVYVWAVPRPIYERIPQPVDCQMTSTSMAGWLRQFTFWIRLQDTAGDFYTELQEAVETVLQVMDSQPVKEYIGKCGHRGDEGIGAPCLGELWASPGSVEVKCRTCLTHWNVDDRRKEALTGVMDRVESPETIARALKRHGYDINAERIYNWKKRGKLTPVGCDRKSRRPTYRLQDVMDVWEATQRSPQNNQRTKDTTP